MKNYAKIETLRWSSKYFYIIFYLLILELFYFCILGVFKLRTPRPSNNATEASNWDENLDSLVSRKFKTRQNHVLSLMVMSLLNGKRWIFASFLNWLTSGLAPELQWMLMILCSFINSLTAIERWEPELHIETSNQLLIDGNLAYLLITNLPVHDKGGSVAPVTRPTLKPT